ncbi:MAG: hypothetical protein SVW57_09090, partial [Thermodesulfobacteriota bacterium]|nr:hypothetical protein [Thermodesulfobacteriota bacterium]
MALESQGVEIRRATTSLATAASSVISVSSGATAKILSSDTAVIDFVTNSFTSGMRITLSSTNDNNTAVYTAKSVASSVIELYESATADASTDLSITGSTMEKIGDITSFNGPTGSAAVIDVTNLGSTAKEKMMGIPDEGQFSFEVNLNTTATALHRTLKDDRAERAERTFDVRLTDQST